MAQNDPKSALLGPKSAFCIQNGVLEPQNAFWAPKCSLAKRGQGVYTSFATAVEENDVSKMMNLMENKKTVKVKNEKPDFDINLYIFVKFIIKIIIFALCTKQWKNKSQMESIFVKIAKITLLTLKSLFEPKITFECQK